MTAIRPKPMPKKQPEASSKSRKGGPGVHRKTIGNQFDVQPAPGESLMNDEASAVSDSGKKNPTTREKGEREAAQVKK